MASEQQWTAIILAGQRPGENSFARSQGVWAKALIPVGGEPMLGRVAMTLLRSPSIGKVVVLAQEPEALLRGELIWMTEEPRIVTARAGDGISRSIEAVAGGPQAPWPVLVVTADHALLTVPMVETFIAGSGGADIAFALVERRVVEASYPETRRTWLRFSDGDYSGANLFALAGPGAAKALALWSGVERDRKKALKLLMAFGPLLAIRAVTRTISLDKAVEKVARKAGFDAAPVRLPFAEAAIDVDKVEDLRLVEEILRRG